MRSFLNAGFGDPLGVSTLEALKSRGYVGIRQDVPSLERAPALCAELAEAGLQPILLVAGGKMAHNEVMLSPHEIADLAAGVCRIAMEHGLFDQEHPAAIEIGNEPDIAVGYNKRPDEFAQAVRLATSMIRQVSDRSVIVTGGITTTNRRGLDYLKAAIRHGIPEDVSIGYHTYRTTVAPEEAHQGFRTRDEEFAELKTLARGRALWCTETGWHTAPSTVKYGLFKLFKKRVQFNERQVADFAEREARINARHGAVGFVWFQLNDGPDRNEYEHCFGIRDLQGNWKPVAERLTVVSSDLA